MHTKSCIASLAFTACNWELLCSTELILLQTTSPKHDGALKGISMNALLHVSGFRKSGHKLASQLYSQKLLVPNLCSTYLRMYLAIRNM